MPSPSAVRETLAAGAPGPAPVPRRRAAGLLRRFRPALDQGPADAPRAGPGPGGPALWRGRRRGLLLDTYEPGRPGGTGQRFDWGLIPPALAPSIVLAGGLEPGERGRGHPRASGPMGSMSAAGSRPSRGVKDPAKIQPLCKEYAMATDAFMHGGDRWRQIRITDSTGPMPGATSGPTAGSSSPRP